MHKWRVAAYLRLSSDDKDKLESNSITNQKNIVAYYLENQKDLKLHDFYIDDGFSGTDFDRPDFQRLLSDMKNGKINAIIVKDLSRLGRNYIEVGNYIEQIFPLYNIRFIAINDNIDSYKDPKSVDNIIVPFKNLMNDEYARDISNKVRSVLHTKKKKGEFTGISAPYGYLKNPKNKHKFIVDKNASKVVKKIFKMILDGKSKDEVIDELNKCGILPPALYKMSAKIVKAKITDSIETWKPKMLDRILQNQSYTGDLVQGKRKRISHKVHTLTHTDSSEWIIVPNHHEALISKNDFNQVQNIIYSRDIRVNSNNQYDVFSGYLKCADCGNSLTIRRAKGHEYFYCSSYMKKKLCSKHTTNKNKLSSKVLDIINNQINLLIDIDEKVDEIIKDNNINYDIDILNNRIDEINNNIIKYETLKSSIKDDLDHKYISQDDYIEYESEYSLIIKNINSEKITTERQLEQIGLKSEKNKEWINEFKKNKNLNTLTRKAVDELIDNIYIYENGNIKVVFKYKDEYIEAMDFINKYNYDIMNKQIILV